MANFLNQQQIVHSCGVAFSLSLIGGRWKAAILFEVIQGVQRFGEIKKNIDGISERILALKLTELEKDQLIIKTTHGQMTKYHLTPYGETMKPLLDELSKWGLQNMNGPNSIDPRD